MFDKIKLIIIGIGSVLVAFLGLFTKLKLTEHHAEKLENENEDIKQQNEALKQNVEIQKEELNLSNIQHKIEKEFDTAQKKKEAEIEKKITKAEDGKKITITI